MHYIQIIIILDGSILESLLLEYISSNKRKRAILTDDIVFDYIHYPFLVKTHGKIEILIG